MFVETNSNVAKFLKTPSNSGKVIIKGKRVNRGGGFGLEMPREYHFYMTRQNGQKYFVNINSTSLLYIRFILFIYIILP